MNDTTRQAMMPLWNRVLDGENVRVGVYDVYEDFIYTRKKDENGSPEFDRAITIVYYDDDSNPSIEKFDGSFESFLTILESHDAFEVDDEE